MTEHDCRSCLFYYNCSSRRSCDNYSPVGDAAESEALDTYIEDRREEFREAWHYYTSEDFE